jgi:type IV secretory pathway VirB3-like protein
MAAPVCRAFCRPKLIHGIEWKMLYLILLAVIAIAFVSIWNPRRLLLLPIVYFGPYTVFRWAGKHDAQWSEIYIPALHHRTVYLAGGDPREAEPSAPRVLPELPKFNA